MKHDRDLPAARSRQIVARRMTVLLLVAVSNTLVGQSPVAGSDPFFAGQYSGSVTDTNGKPIHDARIYLIQVDGKRGQAGPERARTNAEGRFEFTAPDMIATDFDGLPTGRRCLAIATAKGYGPDWVSIRGRSRNRNNRDPSQGTNLELKLPLDDTPIRGQLLDADGHPLIDARVQVAGLKVPKDHDLDAHLKRMSGEFNVFLSPNYESYLYQPATLPQLTAETTTDANGRFTLPGLGRERLVDLSVTAPSVIDTTIGTMTRNTKDSESGANFVRQLERGLTIRGRVINSETREPIPGMWVGMKRDPPLMGLTDGEYPRKTDASGRFEITGIDPDILTYDDNDYREVMAASSPGLPYQTAVATIQDDLQVVIECERGIPFRLKLLDEQGMPIEAEVTYISIHPNPSVSRTLRDSRWPVSRAGQNNDGSYTGFVLPGPGAVLVKAKGDTDYRPAHVDPMAFFDPNLDRNAAKNRLKYGSPDTLMTPHSWLSQHLYDAIVLVDPPIGSGPLDLEASVTRDTPREITLVDSSGTAVVGATAHGLVPHDKSQLPLRSATFPLRGLHPNRTRPMVFYHDDRQLVGSLRATADQTTKYQVRMQTWAKVTGRIVDEKGSPLAKQNVNLVGTPKLPEQHYAKTDNNGRFTVPHLIPGRSYRVEAYHGKIRFALVNSLVLPAGGNRDLGDLRLDITAVATTDVR